MSADAIRSDGGCDCSFVGFRMSGRTMIVHCCHCRWWQRESGAAFALNALIEADRHELLAGEPAPIDTPPNSGKRQKIWRSPGCMLAMSSNYAGEDERFPRGEPDAFERYVQLSTSSKQPRVTLPAAARSFREYYEASEVWPMQSHRRRAVPLAH